MRLALIVIFGLIAISAAYAWGNLSSSQTKENKIEHVFNLKRKQNIAQSPNHTTVTTVTTTTTVPVTAIDGHATTLDAARVSARSSVGKPDPFAPLTPAVNEQELKKTTGIMPSPGNGLNIPPPPPGAVNPFGSATEGHAGQLGSGLDLGELPNPPDDAGINHKIDVVGIVGDRAIFTIKDNLLRRRHHWPKTFTLAIGQSFESLKLTAIKDESVTVEEDGQTFSKPMPIIK